MFPFPDAIEGPGYCDTEAAVTVLQRPAAGPGVGDEQGLFPQQSSTSVRRVMGARQVSLSSLRRRPGSGHPGSCQVLLLKKALGPESRLPVGCLQLSDLK